jgi:hypothetical protein
MPRASLLAALVVILAGTAVAQSATPTAVGVATKAFVAFDRGDVPAIMALLAPTAADSHKARILAWAARAESMPVTQRANEAACKSTSDTLRSPLWMHFGVCTLQSLEALPAAELLRRDLTKELSDYRQKHIDQPGYTRLRAVVGGVPDGPAHVQIVLRDSQVFGTVRDTLSSLWVVTMSRVGADWRLELDGGWPWW